MAAALPLSSASSSFTHLVRDTAFRRSPSLPPTRTAGVSVPCASAEAHERDSAGGCSYHSCSSRSFSGGGMAAGAATAGTLYDVLGLAAGATAQEIKSAYRRLARACHPDVAGRGVTSADEFMRVHAAYVTLSDPDKRAEYDRRVAASVPRRAPPSWWSSDCSPPSFSPSSSSSTGFRQRTWETDQCW